MIKDYLITKYGDAIEKLHMYENSGSIKLDTIIIKPDYRNSGIGSKILSDLVKYGDDNSKIITLTPSSDYGGNKNRLTQFYKNFGFHLNKGYHKAYEYSDAMIRYPRLNEKIKIKSLLRERLFTKDEVDLRQVSDFVNFAKKCLGIDDDIRVFLSFKRTPDLTTTAYYSLDGFIKVYVHNRAIVDIYRSLSHELVHHKQNLEGRLTNPKENGQDGSEIENEANAKAGEIIRRYGKLHPEIYI